MYNSNHELHAVGGPFRRGSTVRFIICKLHKVDLRITLVLRYVCERIDHSGVRTVRFMLLEYHIPYQIIRNINSTRT